jgi:uncharacterized repeat protein (TIGR01451 family)
MRFFPRSDGGFFLNTQQEVTAALPRPRPRVPGFEDFDVLSGIRFSRPPPVAMRPAFTPRPRCAKTDPLSIQVGENVKLIGESLSPGVTFQVMILRGIDGDTIGQATSDLNGNLQFQLPDDFIDSLDAGSYVLAVLALREPTVKTILSIADKSDGSAVEWTKESGGNGHFYKPVIFPGISWPAASVAAQASTYKGLKGHLATLASTEEDAFVEGLLPFTGEFWIGGYQTSGNEWFWVNNQGPIIYTNWFNHYEFPDEPNDCCKTPGIEDGEERYIAIGLYKGGWHDQGYLNSILGYMVEYDDDLYLCNGKIEDLKTPGLCSDGLDNDCDGLVDDLDPGCAPDYVDLWVKTWGPKKLSPGEQFTFNIEYGNRGGTGAGPVRIVDSIPGTNFPSQGWPNDYYEWKPSSVPPHSGPFYRKYHGGVQIGTTEGDYVNYAEINPEYPSPGDYNGANDISKWTFRVCAASDPNYLKVFPDDIVIGGQKLTYTIHFSNDGEGTAFGVYVTDVLDVALNDVTLEVGTGSVYDKASRTIQWNVGTLGPGEEREIEFSVDVRSDGLPGSSIYNYATVHFPSALEETRTNLVTNRVNLPPVAILGPNLTIPSRGGWPVDVELDGSRSVDYETQAESLIYLWSWEGGSAEGQRALVRFPLGTMAVRLIVNDGLADSQPAEVSIHVVREFKRGDVNLDGKTDISDAITTLGFLFMGDPSEIHCLQSADIDDSEKIDISDAIYLLQFLFMGGSPPSAPFPNCGIDHLIPIGLGCLDSSCRS